MADVLTDEQVAYVLDTHSEWYEDDIVQDLAINLRDTRAALRGLSYGQLGQCWCDRPPTELAGEVEEELLIHDAACLAAQAVLPEDSDA